MAVWFGKEGVEGGAGGFARGSVSLVDGSVFARKVGNGLCVEPDVKVLKWEEGKSKGEEAERREKCGK